MRDVIKGDNLRKMPPARGLPWCRSCVGHRSCNRFPALSPSSWTRARDWADRPPRGGRSAQSRARVHDDGERAGKRLQLRWPTQDRHQGRPRAGGIFRKLSPLMTSRIFRSPSVADGHSREEGTPMSDMRRREFIVLLGGAAACPLAMRAQQSSDGGPLIGLLSPLSAGTATRNIEGFRAGLRELGYFEGRNVTLALRFAE